MVGLALAAKAGAAAGKPLLTAAERLAPEQLKLVHEDRLRFEQERRPVPELSLYQDFRAVLHVHAEDSNHTKGSRAEVLAAAKKAGVNVVMLSDHRGPKPETWRGLHEGILFFAGSEDDDGVLRYPAFDTNGVPLPQGSLRLISHIEERYDADPSGFAGMEICNRHSDAKLDPAMERFVLSAMENKAAWNKFVDSFKSYPDEVFAAGTDYHAKFFAVWDRVTAQRPFTGIAANDAHQNQIYNGVTFDPYEVSFRNLSTHFLARELTEAEIRQALLDGHAYVSHDWLCDPSGFTFGAYNNLGAFPMGDRALMWDKTRITAFTPLAADLRLFHNGSLVHQTNGTNFIFEAKLPGAYRLEAWLTVGGEARPWIYSNPVYLEKPSWSSLPWPVMDPAAPVTAKKDIVYTTGKAEDESKHKLDIYAPKEKPNAPVFIFFHGGAWRSGDRALYPALGYRFAKEGILTVVPSYRLAPKNKHPAQLEDAAAAFDWVSQHIAEYGGDPKRIYVGGHSAGGHMAALLALDESYLKARGHSVADIRGVISMSGVFDLYSIGDSQSSVFGKDPVRRKDASPLFHINGRTPPFLVTCCQWDYVPLCAQARQFCAALQKAGAVARLNFTPRESHISEMIAITHEEDPTARAVLQFIR
ncbi:MAG TPA: alpha/beta hydrolase fold domain-containing protein [Candidatus Saccharimonadales bacterium]|nr:alpha/beta hydrolase fold domain-containing protein [Candidatus Saccharimonadales bacterium]